MATGPVREWNLKKVKLPGKAAPGMASPDRPRAGRDQVARKKSLTDRVLTNI
ncbi:MAG: hypothetical protein OP8BY_0831 [Candidatus Saccharicenans subterraneus]|uniref:Uncharacterized protein n=1 Tax=Candidatus Saccharicenans subterraneus TaxID=2508984 RepID=A0A3E2BQ95_9BACT|nr:MAG: hypothetical protein OP8BY_0831 [Candidatus Saccharicenans subterraneum]